MPAVQSSFFLGLLGVVFAISCALPQTAEAQLQLPSTVRLPVFKSFYYQGSVKVPDGGTLSLGGSTRSSTGAIRRGVPGLGQLPVAGRGLNNRGLGGGQQAENASVKADILMLDELEAEHLAKAGYGFGESSPDDILKQAAFLTKHIGRNPQVPLKNQRSLPRPR
ncbi:MAG: hypothetical protein P8J33_05790 [Pirellulaceae bacterium]|nr:hypothetical protein [Pirellulaceae bacterium]